ncbi:hypothetical protein [Streptomyces sp. NPDC057909]|uniref:hypothetical protein n=1 Tax=Streptomyces sp. NPDC057909 TaxID=3346277 RepID=UPI0036EF1B75
MSPVVPIRPRPRPTRAGVADGSALPLTVLALAFALAQLLFFVPGLNLSWDESVYAGQVTPHIPSAYFSAPRARGVPALLANSHRLPGLRIHHGYPSPIQSQERK